MIVSLFGPDGVGKSTIAKAFAAKGWLVFSGTGVASWPDRTWHNQLIAEGLHEPSIDNPEHFLEKIRRLYELANRLEKSHGKVVIDSNPFHKTLMYAYAKALPDQTKARGALEERFAELSAMIQQHTSPLDHHIYFQVSDSQDSESQAKVLQERVQARGTLAYFDPKSFDESLRMIEACQALLRLLQEKNSRTTTVFTDKPLDATALRQLIKLVET